MATAALKIVSSLRTGVCNSVRGLASLKSTNPPDVETHTGQKFDKNDYRQVRFTNNPKQVNPHHAIKLIAEVPPIEVDARTVYCNGGHGALGHPKVYINLDPPGNHDCMYCGLRYTRKPHHH